MIQSLCNFNVEKLQRHPELNKQLKNPEVQPPEKENSHPLPATFPQLFGVKFRPRRLALPSSSASLHPFLSFANPTVKFWCLD